MSFWSKLGKIGLAVAPYAAMAIPGVGIPLGMAIQGGISAAQAKASGGSWKNALISGGIGAATSAVGGGALKSIGPSSGVAAKLLGGAAGKTGLGAAGKIGEGLGNLGRQVASSELSQNNNGTGAVQAPTSGTAQYNPNAGRGGNAVTQPSSVSQSQGGRNNPYYQAIRNPTNSTPTPGLGPTNQNPQPGGNNGGNGGGGSSDPGPLRQYTGEDVGHEGTTRGGMNRQQYRDAWMGSGIGNSQQMDAWLAQNGGQRLNDSGVVRTPFGEILDMGIGYKGGNGKAGWTDIGMNNLSASQGWGQPYNPPPQNQPAAPAQPAANQPSYWDFVNDYWAPDREQVLAGMADQAPQNQAPPPPANSTYAQRLAQRGGGYVYDY